MSAYELNRLMYDLREPANREAVREDLDAYLDRYAVTEPERDLVRRRDWGGLVEAGVSIYVLTKIGAALDVSLYAMGAQMRGMSMDEFWRFIGEQNERSVPHAILP